MSPKSNSKKQTSPTRVLLQARSSCTTSPPGAPGTWHEAMGTEGPPSSCSTSPTQEGGDKDLGPAGLWLSVIFVPHGAGSRCEHPREPGNANTETIPTSSRLLLHLGHSPHPGPPAAAPRADPAPRSQPGKGPSEVLGGQGGGSAGWGCPGSSGERALGHRLTSVTSVGVPVGWLPP